MLRQTTRTILTTTKPVERIICPSVFVGGQRLYHKSASVENELIVGGLMAAGGAMTLQYAIAAYRNYQASRPPPKPEEEAKEAKATKAEPAAEAPKAKKASTGSSSSTASNPNSSVFATWFARNFYDGGFEEKMSKREAALILGIRESASVEKVKEAHRRILLLNHPDRGGSAHIAAKINEAKDLLLKGKQ